MLIGARSGLMAGINVPQHYLEYVYDTHYGIYVINAFIPVDNSDGRRPVYLTYDGTLTNIITLYSRVYTSTYKIWEYQAFFLNAGQSRVLVPVYDENNKTKFIRIQDDSMSLDLSKVSINYPNEVFAQNGLIKLPWSIVDPANETY